MRWNALVPELKVDRVSGATPEHGLEAVRTVRALPEGQGVVAAEHQLEPRLPRSSRTGLARATLRSIRKRLAELETALRHHLTKNRLADVWALKERFQKVLEGAVVRWCRRIRSISWPTRWAIPRWPMRKCRRNGRR